MASSFRQEVPDDHVRLSLHPVLGMARGEASIDEGFPVIRHRPLMITYWKSTSGFSSEVMERERAGRHCHV
jgi:hypothetical protein